VAGTEISTLRIAQALSEPDFQHVAFCSTEGGAVESFFRAAGFSTAIYRPVDLSYRKPGPFLKASFDLARTFRRQRIDLVHCSDLMAGLRAAPAARLARLPVVCHIRNPHPDVGRHDRPLLRAVNRFIFVSRHAWQSFSYPVPADRGSLVYDGIERSPIDREVARQRLRAQFSLAPDTKLVGMVGRLAAQKDYPTLIRAAARVLSVYPNVRFLVVGDHTTTDDFRQHYLLLAELVAKLRIKPSVIFTGFRDDVSHVVSALDISVLATHFEGFGLVLVEAMAQGTPVIGTAVGGITEIIADQETGLLHGHADDADLASKILALLCDDALAQRLASAGRRFVEERFSMSRFATGITHLYRRMLSTGHTSRGT
jgi:glycosyltransferase involved in cell wall biosynthesis